MYTRILGSILVPVGGAPPGPFSWSDDFNTYGSSNSLAGHGGWGDIFEGGEGKPSLGVSASAGGYAFDDFGDGFGNLNGTALTGWNPALGYTYECQVGFFVSGVGSVFAAFAEIFVEMTDANAETAKLEVSLDYLDQSFVVMVAGVIVNSDSVGISPNVYHTLTVTVSPLRAVNVTLDSDTLYTGTLPPASVTGRVGMIGYLDGDMEELVISRFGFMSILSMS